MRMPNVHTSLDNAVTARELSVNIKMPDVLTSLDYNVYSHRD